MVFCYFDMVATVEYGSWGAYLHKGLLLMSSDIRWDLANTLVTWVVC